MDIAVKCVLMLVFIEEWKDLFRDLVIEPFIL